LRRETIDFAFRARDRAPRAKVFLTLVAYLKAGSSARQLRIAREDGWPKPKWSFDAKLYLVK
jgi:hypothetical protein